MIPQTLRPYAQLVKFQSIILLSVIMGCLFYFWSQGYVDGERQRSISDASYKIKSIKKALQQNNREKQLLTISESDVINHLKGLRKDINDNEWLFGSTHSEEYIRSYDNSLTALNKLISQPNMNEIIKVLRKKVDLFASYVSSNKWKTLTRLSSRVQNITSQANMSSGNIQSILKTSKRDVNAMKKVTLGSVLSDFDKKQIVTRLEDLETELNMLSSYIDLREQAIGQLEAHDQALMKMVGEIGPEISVQKLKSEDVGKTFALIILLIAACVFVQMLLMLGLMKRFSSRARKKIEQRVLNIAEEGIVKGDDRTYNDLSADTFNKLNTISQYVEKRMSFSSIFQETIPFEAFLLDDNLRVIWANKSLYQSFGLTDNEMTHDLLTWDFLKKSTNLDDNDPILDCIKRNVSGIYQIHVFDGNGGRLPYEMYVRSVREDNTRFVMVYLNCLVAMQETIDAQVKSLINPIQKTLKTMIKDEFNQNYYKESLEQFKLVGIEGILNDFLKLYEVNQVEREDSQSSFESLVSQYESLEIKVNKAFDLGEEISRSGVKMLKDFSVVRENIIDVASMNNRLNEIANDLLCEIKKIRKKAFTMAQGRDHLVHLVEESHNSLPNIDGVKDELKESRDNLKQVKSRVTQSMRALKKSFSCLESSGDPQLMTSLKNLEKLNEDMANLEASFGLFDKKINSLEVIISKTKLVFSGLSSATDESCKISKESLYETSQSIDKPLAGEIEDMGIRYQALESSIVNELKKLHGHARVCSDKALKIRKLKGQENFSHRPGGISEASV